MTIFVKSLFKKDGIVLNHKTMPFSWLPFALCSSDESLPCPDGFDEIPINPGDGAILMDSLRTEDFSAFCIDGGHLYVPSSVLSWLRLYRHFPDHPFCKALHLYTQSSAVRCWHTGKGPIELTEPKIMAIWNVSPDSFSSYCEMDGAASLEHARKLVDEHADILDIGAESTRPGAHSVSHAEEIERLQVPLSWAREHVQIPISLDSRHPQTLQWALDQGLIDVINDVALTDNVGLREKEIVKMAEKSGSALVIMAWQAHDAHVLPFDDCLTQIVVQLAERLSCAFDEGLDLRQIVVDPGIGFGKGLDNDFRLITESPRALECLGRPVLVAHSRKRCLAKMTGLPIDKLDIPTAISAAFSYKAGAAVIRTHCPALANIAQQMACALEIPND